MGTLGGSWQILDEILEVLARCLRFVVEFAPTKVDMDCSSLLHGSLDKVVNKVIPPKMWKEISLFPFFQ